MSPSYFFTITFLFCVAECVIDDYRYVSEIDGFLKMHRVAAKWQDARLRCYLEGGVLASPTDSNIVAAMKDIMMTKDNLHGNLVQIFTGIHATYSSGDFTTVTGLPLSQIDVQWENNELDSYKYGSTENCLVMFESGGLAAADCTAGHPYFCFKSVENIDKHKCGVDYVHSDYKLDNRTGSCYKFHKIGRSWPNAFKTCMAEDAHLAIVNSNIESAVLKELFNRYSHDDIPGKIHKDAASIGFTKWQEYGEWFTIHGESLADAGFSTFNAGEPNNLDNPELCGSLWRNGLFNDHNCNIVLAFICEKAPSLKDNQQNLE